MGSLYVMHMVRQEELPYRHGVFVRKIKITELLHGH